MMAESLRELQAQVEDLTSRFEALSQEITDLSAAVSVTSNWSPLGDEEQAYPSLEAWVSDFFAPTFRRPIGGEFRWCTHWQDHPEAVLRLQALWRAWALLHADGPLGSATWLTNHLDPQLAVLLGRGGPFGQCSTDRHAIGEPLSSPSPGNNKHC